MTAGKFIHSVAVAAMLVAANGSMNAQSIHFSQYYNAPMLTNPANTALLPDNDYRFGMNYRTQWVTIPVPYTTFSAFADFKALGGKNENQSSWLGLGAALFNDKAGDGNLSLTRFEGFAAYHLQMSSTSMLSLGLSGGYVERSVNYDNLTFDAQWDGLTFNSSLPNAEKVGIIKTTYATVAGGLNFSFFPNENFFLKVGGGVANINQPTESFYGGDNQIGIRPTANIDAVIRLSPIFIMNPSFYYTTQMGASELLAGSLFRTRLTSKDDRVMELILGAYYRLNEAAIGAIGFQYAHWQLMATYDITMSTLTPYNGGNGALEFSLIYQNVFNKSPKGNKIISCPRFF